MSIDAQSPGFAPYRPVSTLVAVSLRSITQGTLHRPRGFTLMELMLAIVVFAVGIVAAAELLQRAHAATEEGENLLTATHLAQWRIEELRNVAYANLADESKAAIANPSGFSRFSRDVTVTTPYTNLKQIVIHVYWNAPGGEVNVALQTYRSAS